jgi:hypothetical protein
MVLPMKMMQNSFKFSIILCNPIETLPHLQNVSNPPSMMIQQAANSLAHKVPHLLGHMSLKNI